MAIVAMGMAAPAEAAPLRYTFSYAPVTLNVGDSGYSTQVTNLVSFSFVLDSTPGSGPFALPAPLWLDLVSRSATASVVFDTAQVDGSVDWQFLSTTTGNFVSFDSVNFTPTDPGTYAFQSVEGAASAGTSSFNFNGTGALTIEAVSNPVPEPSTGGLAGLALVGLGLVAAHRQRAQPAA